MSASVTVIPRLPGGRMGRRVSSSSLSMNLSTPSSGGTTSEDMEESREAISKSKISSLGLLLWYTPLSWWYRVYCLRNIHDARWMRRSLDFTYSPPENLDLQAPAPPPSHYAMCSATFPWWGQRGAASRQLLRIWPHGRVGSAWLVALCFIAFCDFLDSVEYGVARSGLL